jgi:hypothetical protein
MRKLLSGNLRLHAGQFSEITIPHFLFAGADEVIFSSKAAKPPGTADSSGYSKRASNRTAILTK